MKTAYNDPAEDILRKKHPTPPTVRRIPELLRQEEEEEKRKKRRLSAAIQTMDSDGFTENLNENPSSASSAAGKHLRLRTVYKSRLRIMMMMMMTGNVVFRAPPSWVNMQCQDR